MLPCERVAGIQSELAEESALCPPVALPERVHRIDLRVVVGEPLGELASRQIVEMPLIAELAQHLGCVPLDVLGQCEHAAGLGEWHATQLASPGIDVLEDEAMELLKVSKIVDALQSERGKLHKS